MTKENRFTQTLLVPSCCQNKNVWTSDKSWEPDLTLSLSQSLIHSLSSYWTTFVFMSMLKSHSHTISLSQCLTLSLFHSISHSLTLHMLNNFCFHVYAQKSLSHSLTFTLSHSHSFSLSHSFNLSFTHSRHAEQLLFPCLGSNVTLYRWKCQWFFLPHPILLL